MRIKSRKVIEIILFSSAIIGIFGILKVMKVVHTTTQKTLTNHRQELEHSKNIRESTTTERKKDIKAYVECTTKSGNESLDEQGPELFQDMTNKPYAKHYPNLMKT